MFEALFAEVLAYVACPAATHGLVNLRDKSRHSALLALAAFVTGLLAHGINLGHALLLHRGITARLFRMTRFTAVAASLTMKICWKIDEGASVTSSNIHCFLEA